MAGQPSNSRKRLVEDCEVIGATSENLKVCYRVGIGVSTT
jgi:hypothetical protein